MHDGNGPPCLLVHGFLSSTAHWTLNVRALARVSRPVAVDLYGHGRSPTPADPGRYSPAAYAEEFDRIRRRLGADRWLLCGSSLGAALTLRYALDRPERVIAHVFTNSNSALADRAWAERIRSEVEAEAHAIAEGGKDALARHPLHPRHVRHVPAEAKDALVADAENHDPMGIARTMLHTVPLSPLRDRVEENRVPSLLVVGEKEKRFAGHRRYAEEVMPHLDVVGLRVGHAVNLQDAAGFNAAVTAFVLRARESHPAG